ncbi:MAG: hypothetical protein ACKO5R_10980 [Planctomycetaceae bacterium]
MPADDIAAIAIAVAAAAWLVRGWMRSLTAPPCGAGRDVPAGADGFVPLDGLAPPPRGRQAPRPASPPSPRSPG